MKLGLATGLAAAACNLAVLLVARWRGWDLQPPGMAAVRPLSVVAVCVLVGFLAAVAAYVAARVTKHPAVWVVVGGAGLWLASIQDLPRTLQVMHAITALWIVGWLARAVLRGSHVR